MKKGFTLIELLAVIVILAIIALIATPIVLNIISNTKESATIRSAENYISAVEQAVAAKQLDGNVFNPDTCTTLDNGNLLCGEETLEVSFNGSKSASGATIKFNKGSVVGISNFNIGGKNVLAASLGLEEAIEASICVLKEGTAKEVGSKYECEVKAGTKYNFYVLEVTEDNISLIMNSNIDNTKITYCDSSGANPLNGQLCQADGARARLNESTNDWINVDEVSLPTAQQIVSAANDTSWETGSTCIDLPTWLYDFLEGTENSVANVTGYWTSTPYSLDPSPAWCVISYGQLVLQGVDDSSSGVRPVITISKSKI